MKAPNVGSWAIRKRHLAVRTCQAANLPYIFSVLFSHVALFDTNSKHCRILRHMYLNNHTYYSLRYGTLSPQQLVEQAIQCGMTRVVLTDINNTSALFEFYRACRDAGVVPIAGIEFRQENQMRYIGIARNEEGFRELTSLLTSHLMDGRMIPRIAPPWKHAVAIYTALPKPIESFLPHEYYGIRPQDVHGLYSSPLRHHPDRLVALAPVTFQQNDGHRLHKLLRCIDENIVIGRLADYPI